MTTITLTLIHLSLSSIILLLPKQILIAFYIYHDSCSVAFSPTILHHRIRSSSREYSYHHPLTLPPQHSKKLLLSTNSSENRSSSIHDRNNYNHLEIKHDKLEKTVVLLYYKPQNVITSHSNLDSTRATTTTRRGMLYKDDHDNDTKKIEKNDERITVYDDIQSMKGYIPNNINNKNDNYKSSSSSSNTSKNNKQHKSFQEVTGIQSKLHAIGRLDVDTTGLLLLTNDGGLVHHVTNPTASTKHESGFTNNNNEIIKTYEALIMGYHTLPPPPGPAQKNDESNMISNIDSRSSTIDHDGNDNDYDHNDDNENDNTGCPKSTTTQNYHNHSALMKLYQGVDIGSKYGGMTKPVHNLQVLSHPTPKSTLVRISISEGKNRQVRRMFHAIGSGVMKLHRCRIGNIDLSMLDCDGGNGGNGGGSGEENSTMIKEGSWRILTDEEVLDGLGWKVRRLSWSKDQHQSNSSNSSSYKKKKKKDDQSTKKKRRKSSSKRRKPKSKNRN